MSHRALLAVGHFTSQLLGPIRTGWRFFVQRDDGVVLKLSRNPGLKTARRLSWRVRMLKKKALFLGRCHERRHPATFNTKFRRSIEGARLVTTFMIVRR